MHIQFSSKSEEIFIDLYFSLLNKAVNTLDVYGCDFSTLKFLVGKLSVQIDKFYAFQIVNTACGILKGIDNQESFIALVKEVGEDYITVKLREEIKLKVSVSTFPKVTVTRKGYYITTQKPKIIFLDINMDTFDYYDGEKFVTMPKDIDAFLAENEGSIIVTEEVIRLEELKEVLEELVRKGVEHGCKVILVDPKNNSNKCPRCGNIGVRRNYAFRCPYCGFVFDAQFVATLNIAEKFFSTYGMKLFLPRYVQVVNKANRNVVLPTVTIFR